MDVDTLLLVFAQVIAKWFFLSIDADVRFDGRQTQCFDNIIDRARVENVVGCWFMM